MAYKDKAVKTQKQNEYIGKTYDRINLLVPKGCKERIQSAAKANGESVNALINRLIEAEIRRIEQCGGISHFTEQDKD